MFGLVCVFRQTPGIVDRSSQAACLDLVEF